MRQHHALLLTTLTLVGCNDDVTAEPDAGTTPSNPISQADRVVCEFYYRVTNDASSDTDPSDLQFQEETLEVRADDEKSVDVGDMTLSVSYSEDRFEGSSLHVGVEAGEVRLFNTLYQLRDGRLPTNQFVGDHGFTGLIYLTHPVEGGDYQLICKSVGGS